MGATMGGGGQNRAPQWAGAQRDAALGGANVPINQIIRTVGQAPGGVPGQGPQQPQAMGPQTWAWHPQGNVAQGPAANDPRSISQMVGGVANQLNGGIPNFGGQQQGQNPYGAIGQFLQQYLQQQQGGGFGGGGYPSTYQAPGGLYALPSGGYNYGQGGGGYGGGYGGGFDPYAASRQMALQQIFGQMGGGGGYYGR